MNSRALHDFWASRDDEFLKFDRVAVKLSGRPDLHAFLLLDKLVPGNRDLICGAGHDEFYIGVEPEELTKVASEEELIDLHRCGVRCDPDNGLCVFA